MQKLIVTLSFEDNSVIFENDGPDQLTLVYIGPENKEISMEVGEQVALRFPRE